MMSAIDAGTPAYQPAQLLSWVYMSLQDSSQSGALDKLRAEPDTSAQLSNSKRGAADLNSNYVNNFLHLQSEVGLMLVRTLCSSRR